MASQHVCSFLQVPLGRTTAFELQQFRQSMEISRLTWRFRQELDPEPFDEYPQVNLLAAVIEGIKERRVVDPYATSGDNAWTRSVRAS